VPAAGLEDARPGKAMLGEVPVVVIRDGSAADPDPRGRHPGRPYRPGRQHHRHGLGVGRRLGRVVLLPLLLIAAVSLLISSLVSAGPGRRGCGKATVMVMAAQQRMTAGHAAGAGGATGIGGTNCRTASPQSGGGSR
jgi:hypothetical protein